MHQNGLQRIFAKTRKSVARCFNATNGNGLKNAIFIMHQNGLQRIFA
jgi:hypothetical protein